MSEERVIDLPRYLEEVDAEQWSVMLSKLPEVEQIKLHGWLVAVVTADLLDDLFERLGQERRGLAEETMEMSLRS